MAGFVEFFYNIIPGGIFLSAVIATFNRVNPDFLEGLLPKFIMQNNAATLGVFVIISLFLGFAFQMLNTFLQINKLESILKKKYQDNEVNENKQNYNDALERLKEKYNFKDSDNLDWLLEAHYCMDDYLRFNNTSAIHNFFHTRISLWANTMTASIIYALIVLFVIFSSCTPFKENLILLILFLISILLAIFCCKAARRSQKTFCDFVLKTYLMVTEKIQIRKRSPRKKR